MLRLNSGCSVALSALAVAISTFVSVDPAFATNGYFQTGYGASSKGIAGGGVALSMDSLAAATNPASMVNVGNRMDVEIGLFSPDRTIKGDGTVNGSYHSENELFLIPEFGINSMLDDVSSIGLTLSANGGMNTEYSSNPFVSFGAGASTGTAASKAPAGVDLSQLLLGLTYARKFDKHSFGVTPTFAFQRFSADGLQGFEGISARPFNVHGKGYDYSAGGGVRLGYLGEVASNLTVGASLASKMYMQPFDKYNGLFAEGGDFDIPANMTIGAAYVIPDTDLTVSLDWQHIWYGDVGSISNSGAKNFNQDCVGDKKLGNSNGCGFGWDDQDTLKLGFIYSGYENLVLRAGVSHNTQVYENGESLFNILAPAVVRTHASVGGTYSFSEAHAVNVSYTRAFSESQVGTHPNQQAGKTVTHTMDQHDLVVGYTYNW